MLTEATFAKKSFGSVKIYFPLILSPAFRNVIFTPVLLSLGFPLSAYIDSKDILYIVKFSIYPFVSFLIKSLGKSITNLLSHSRRFKSSGFLLEGKILLKIKS